MATRESVAIELTGGRLRAVETVRNNGGLRVRRIAVDDAPSQIDTADVDALGQWIRERLDAAKISRSGVIWQVGREHVAVKRLVLPTTDPDELPDMTRFAMVRELPFEADNIVIDFVAMPPDERETVVLAAAIPAAELDRQRAIAKQAGCKVVRIALRSMGTAALIRTDPRWSTQRVLVIDVTRGRADFGVLDASGVRFARSAEINGVANGDHTTDALVSETHRTWMSYRMTDDGSDVDHVLLFGERARCEDAVKPMAAALERPVEFVTDHAHVSCEKVEADRVWPLVGQVLGLTRDLPAIDFASPRQPKDHAGRRRKMVLAAAGAIVVSLLALWTLGQRDLRGLQTELDGLKAQRSSLYKDYADCIREADQLKHIDRWMTVEETWLDHIDYLLDLSPSSEQLVLDGWSGAINFKGVKYDRKSKTWSQPATTAIEVSGEAKDRTIADIFRAALVDSERYIASSSGSDVKAGRRLPISFTYRLTSDVRNPAPDADAKPTMTASRGKDAP
ncbi:MAG: hypothetical protein AAF432_03540 [Planctomycetota bacterium]